MTIAKFKERIDRIYPGILAFIFVVTVLTRILGINWGMPYGNLHPDEGIVYFEAYSNTYNHTLEVHSYYRPNHVSIKLNTILYTGIQELCFETRGLSDFNQNYNEHFALFTTASRVLMALFGIGVVVFAYLIALNFGKRIALLAALLFAVLPSFIEHSHYITPDIILLFCLLGILWAAFKYLKDPSVKWLAWLAFMSSLATCEKYPGVYGCIIIAAVVITVNFKEPVKIVKHGIMAILLFVLGIFIISPEMILDYRNVLTDMAGQNKSQHPGADGLDFIQTLLYYVKTAAVEVGFIMTAMGIYGIFKIWKTDSKKAIIMLVFLAYIFPISVLKIHWERYTLPVYAIILLFASIGIGCLINDLCEKYENRKTVQWVAVLLLIALPVASLGLGAVAMTGKFLAPDSRVALAPVFAELGITKDNAITDCSSPLDFGGYYGAYLAFDDMDPGKYKYGVCPPYVVTSASQRDVYLNEDPNAYGYIASFYQKLDAEYDMVVRFEVENPKSHFIELCNIWHSAKSVYHYLQGAMTGFEIRVYQVN